MSEEALGRDEVLSRVLSRVLAAARRFFPPDEAEGVAQAALRLLSTKYAHVASASELVAIGACIVHFERTARTPQERAPVREPEQVLPGYATDSLGDHERRELLRAALDDQELFDRLVEAEGLLKDPAAREELRAVLERPTLWQRLRSWFEREATLLDLAAVGAVVLAAIVGFGMLAVRPRAGTRETAVRPMGTPLSPLHVVALLMMPENQAVPAGIEITNRPDAVFAPGETVRLRLTLRAPARVVLLAQPPDGPPRQVWPGLGQPPAVVPRPSSGGPAQPQVELEVPETYGTHRLRMVVVPAELDLGAVPANALGARPAALTLVELRYEVAGARNDREPADPRGAKAAAWTLPPRSGRSEG